jgi:hypothetical protein
MIRVTAIANSAAAKAYFALSDYLFKGPEVQAHGHGKGTKMLGLTGPVNHADFEKLGDNINPTTGKQLTAKHLANRPIPNRGTEKKGQRNRPGETREGRFVSPSLF